MPGVRLILTAEDMAELGPLPCVGIPSAQTVDVPTYPILAGDVVRHVGDAVAFVVADTLDQAKDAAEAIAIEWEPLPQVVDAVEALKPGAAQVWPGRAGNLAFERTLGDEAKTAAAFAQAARTVALTLVNQRLVTNYLDTRAVLAEYDAGSERFTLTLGSQGVHTLRQVLAGHILRIDEDRIRVVTPDVGGGFGTKIFP
jgi:carbon-monoxide dehydrogenase large subunit